MMAKELQDVVRQAALKWWRMYGRHVYRKTLKGMIETELRRMERKDM